MRTTVEITAEQHHALAALAQRRGIRGFSPLVREALTDYLNDRELDELDLLLSLEGALTEEDERELQARIQKVRGTWRNE